MLLTSVAGTLILFLIEDIVLKNYFSENSVPYSEQYHFCGITSKQDTFHNA